MFSVKEHSYGKLVEYDHEAFHRRECMGFPAAEILFEAQRHLYDFLVTTTRLLLENAETKDTGDTAWKTQAAEGFSQHVPPKYKTDEALTEDLLYEPLAYLEPPPKFDLDWIQRIIEERQDSSEDELWLLQTEPAHAYDVITAMSNGDYYKSLTTEEKFEAIAYDMCEPPLIIASSFSRLGSQVGWLRHCLAKGESQENIERIMDHMKDSISGTMGGTMAWTILGLLNRDSSFDNTFLPKQGQRITRLAKNQRITRLVSSLHDQFQNKHPPTKHRDQPVLWALGEVVGLQNYEYTPMIATMGNFLNDAVKAKRLRLERVSSRGWQALMDVSALSMIDAMLQNTKPRFLERTDESRAAMEDELEDLITAAEEGEDGYFANVGVTIEQTKEDRKRHRETYKSAGEKLHAFWDLKFEAHRRQKTEVWLKQAIASKNALDDFWEEVRNIKTAELIRGCGFTEENVEWARETRVLELYRKEEYLQSIREDLDELNTSKGARAEKPTSETPATSGRKRSAEIQATPQTVWGELKTSPKRARHSDGDEKKPPKRYQTVDETAENPEPRPAPAVVPHPPPAPPPEIIVSAKTFKNLSRLWPNQSRNSEGTFRWDDFLATMNGIGLKHEHVGGSRVSFKGTNKSILLHAPHGGGKTPVKNGLLQTYGRRLEKRFGWTYKTFPVGG